MGVDRNDDADAAEEDDDGGRGSNNECVGITRRKAIPELIAGARLRIEGGRVTTAAVCICDEINGGIFGGGGGGGGGCCGCVDVDGGGGGGCGCPEDDGCEFKNQ